MATIRFIYVDRAGIIYVYNELFAEPSLVIKKGDSNYDYYLNLSREVPFLIEN